MKKLAVILLALVMVVTGSVGVAESKENSIPANENGFSFGNGVTFGMTQDQVIELDGMPDSEIDDYFIYYDRKAAGFSCLVLYSFSDSGLDSIMVQFTEKHSYENKFIDDFNAVDTSLKTKYSYASILKKYIWKNDLYKDDLSKYGFAVSCGHLQIMSSWIEDEYYISHLLSGDNYEISHMIIYKCYGKNAPAKQSTNTDGI